MVARGITEYLERDDRDKSLDATKLRALSKCANTLDETVKLVERARKAAEETDNRREAGLALCHEFELRLALRQVERARDIVQEVGAYSDDEEVKFEFTRILSEHGLLEDALPMDQMSGAKPQPPKPAQTGKSKLILPS